MQCLYFLLGQANFVEYLFQRGFIIFFSGHIRHDFGIFHLVVQGLPGVDRLLKNGPLLGQLENLVLVSCSEILACHHFVDFFQFLFLDV